VEWGVEAFTHSELKLEVLLYCSHFIIIEWLTPPGMQLFPASGKAYACSMVLGLEVTLDCPPPGLARTTAWTSPIFW